MASPPFMLSIADVMLVFRLHYGVETGTDKDQADQAGQSYPQTFEQILSECLQFMQAQFSGISALIRT